jgi:hypothetical protein
MTAGDLELSTSSAVIDRRYSRKKIPDWNFCAKALRWSSVILKFSKMG